MTYNDLEVSERNHEIRKLAAQLNYLAREGREAKLFEVLGFIHHHAREAMWRMNEVRSKSTK